MLRRLALQAPHRLLLLRPTPQQARAFANSAPLLFSPSPSAFSDVPPSAPPGTAEELAEVSLRSGLEIKYNPLDHENGDTKVKRREAAVALFERGQAVGTIAEQLGVVENTVRSYLESHADTDPSFIPTFNANWDRLITPSATKFWLDSTSYETLKANLPKRDESLTIRKKGPKESYAVPPSRTMLAKQDEVMKMFLSEEMSLEQIKEKLGIAFVTIFRRIQGKLERDPLLLDDPRFKSEDGRTIIEFINESPWKKPPPSSFPPPIPRKGQKAPLTLAGKMRNDRVQRAVELFQEGRQLGEIAQELGLKGQKRADTIRAYFVNHAEKSADFRSYLAANLPRAIGSPESHSSPNDLARFANVTDYASFWAAAVPKPPTTKIFAGKPVSNKNRDLHAAIAANGGVRPVGWGYLQHKKPYAKTDEEEKASLERKQKAFRLFKEEEMRVEEIADRLTFEKTGKAISTATVIKYLIHMIKPQYAPQSHAENRRYLETQLPRIVKADVKHTQGMKTLSGIERKLDYLDKKESQMIANYELSLKI